MNSLGLVCTEASCCEPCDKPRSENGGKKGSVSLCVRVRMQMCYKYLEETDSENLRKLLNSFRFGKWNRRKGALSDKEAEISEKYASPLGIFLNRLIVIGYLLKPVEKDQSVPETIMPGLRLVGVHSGQRAEVNSQANVEFLTVSACVNFTGSETKNSVLSSTVRRTDPRSSSSLKK